MTNDIQITFPGGLRVDATVGDLTIRTDQPIAQGDIRSHHPNSEN